MNRLVYDWKFSKGELPEAYQKNFDDSEWRTVRVPHDYAVEGPFSPENDKQFQEVIADGIQKPIVHVARTGGLPITDHAWYRREFYVSKDASNVFLEFDGIMSHSTVYVNGIECGGRIYGYSSFSVDITKACEKGQENILAISVRPEESASRWYTGAGIYRNVRLVEKNELYFPYCPAYMKTNVLDKNVEVSCEMQVADFGKSYDLVLTIYDAEKKVVAQAMNQTTMMIENFKRWHILDGYLYTLEANLWVEGNVMDTYTTTFGVRTLRFDANEGFFLNGENVKLKGVCMHHDAGALGAVVNASVARRQLEKLMSIGVNAVRCTHNPPAPEFLDLCDELGLVAIDEAYDEWQIKKVNNGYGKYFDAEGEKDLVTMIHRDRNHPCVIMWSIGNEILEQREADGWKVTRMLSEICHREDDTRPTTAGFSMTVAAFENGLCDEVDLVGVNYKPHLYAQFHEQYPNAILYGSETASTISSRGEYFFPAEVIIPAIKRDNYQLSSFDLEAPPWAYYVEREFKAQDEMDYVFGEFVWTGFDYLGEPTPYREEWPSRSSYFGIFDLVGLEKDRAYSYKSRWSNEDVLHIFPHWNWNVGDQVEVHGYSNYDEVELFLNGTSLGVSKKDPEDEILRHRHIWKNITFEPGELKAVAVKHPGLTCVVKTAGAPAKLILEPERMELVSDGEDVVYVRCTAVDANGTVCPNADMHVDFTVEGCGEYLAADNGDPTDIRTFHEPYCHLFHGMNMAIVRSLKGSTGVIKVRAHVEGLEVAEVVIMVSKL